MLPKEDGIYFDIPDSLYFSDKSRVNCSALKTVIKNNGCTKHLEKETLTTEAMRFGSLFHTLVLEPEKFPDKFVIIPDLDMRKPVDKQYLIDIGNPIMLNSKEQDQDRVIAIKQDTMDEVNKLIDGLKYNPDGTITMCYELLKQAVKKEFVVLFSIPVVDQITGDVKPIPCKVKIDAMTEELHIFDLKTCASVEKDKFTKDVIDFNYHIQAKFYKMAVENYFSSIGVKHKPQFSFLCVGKDVYNSQVYNTDLWDDYAESQILMNLQKTYEALTEQKYTGYIGQEQNSEISLEIPSWIENKFIKQFG